MTARSPTPRAHRRPCRLRAPSLAAILIATLALGLSQPRAWADTASRQNIAHSLDLDWLILAQSLNLAWVLVCGFLVMFMQVGFAMLETGFTRAKNAVNTMAMNLASIRWG